MNKNAIDSLDRFKLEGYFIAYLDILGFEDMVKKCGDNLEKPKCLYKKINHCIEYIRGASDVIKSTELKVKIFSDNMLFCMKTYYKFMLEFTT
jgi:hypothetical protein